MMLASIYYDIFFVYKFTIYSELMLPKKHASGSEKRKKKRRIDDLIQSQRGAIDKVFKSNTSTSRNPDEWAIIVVEEMTSHQ